MRQRETILCLSIALEEDSPVMYYFATLEDANAILIQPMLLSMHARLCCQLLEMQPMWQGWHFVYWVVVFLVKTNLVKVFARKLKFTTFAWEKLAKPWNIHVFLKNHIYAVCWRPWKLQENDFLGCVLVCVVGGWVMLTQSAATW